MERFAMITNTHPPGSKAYKLAQAILKYEANRKSKERKLNEISGVEHIIPRYFFKAQARSFSVIATLKSILP